MSKFRKVFKKQHTVIPVVHLETEQQGLINAEIAFNEGADGIFLINHTVGWEMVLDIQSAMKKVYPDKWIGVNCLGAKTIKVFESVPRNIDGIWVDNAEIHEYRSRQVRPQRNYEFKQEYTPESLYFGGVAFKYQNIVEPEFFADVAIKAKDYMDVVTTTGVGTGEAAEIAKIKIMKEALGDFPLAIASGITPENIEEYLPYADCFLVATGISKSFYMLDENLIRKLISKIN